MRKKIRLGIIGGGPLSGIGDAHRSAFQLAGEYELVSGCFSRDKEKSKSFGKALGLDEKRLYASFQEMFAKEAVLSKEERMEAVVIATPNNTHFEAAKLALENGYHVMLEKPITLNLNQAKALGVIAKKSSALCCVNFTYTGYPMIKEARALIAEGQLGEVREIFVEYHQGWLCSDSTVWRTDPTQSGIGGAIADIGVHAFNLAEYIVARKVTDLMADLTSFVKDRVLDDHAMMLLKFDNGARGILTASQVAIGEANHLSIRVYGDKGSLKWDVASPHLLILNRQNESQKILRAGIDNSLLHEKIKKDCAKPPSLEDKHADAMANHYYNFAKAIQFSGVPKEDKDYPILEEGIRSMAFIEAAINSSNSEKKWYVLQDDSLDQTSEATAHRTLSLFT